MSIDEQSLRVGDAEREHTVAVLGEHLAAGRLSMAETDGRLRAVAVAKTRGELAEVLSDLPGIQSPPAPAPAPHHSVAPPAVMSKAPWAPWALTGVICLLVWIATSIAQGQPLNFWPIWVIGPWGIVLLARTGAACATRRR